MKISIITVCYNSAEFIASCIESILNQTYTDIEYIIVDGGSTDRTLEIVSSYRNGVTRLISEPDNGIYNAMNKGIKIATGEIVGILNSDDFLSNNDIIQIIADEFKNDSIDVIYGDVQFVRPDNLKKIIRYYSSKNFYPGKFRYGFMPAHPSFYTKRRFYYELGYFNEDYKIGADFELMIRFFYRNNLKSKYLPVPFVTMRTGGVSNKSLYSNITLNREIKRACSENGIKTNFLLIYLKYFIKIFEFIKRH